MGQRENGAACKKLAKSEGAFSAVQSVCGDGGRGWVGGMLLRQCSLERAFSATHWAVSGLEHVERMGSLLTGCRLRLEEGDFM